MEHNILLVILAIGGLLFSPVIVQYLHRYYVPVAVLAILFMCLNGMAPYSPEARVLLSMVHQVPDTMMDALDNGQNSLMSVNTTYFNSFH